MASKTFAMPRGFGEVAVSEGSLGGMTGRPTKVDEGAIVGKDFVLFVWNALEMLFVTDLPSRDRMCSLAVSWL